MSTSLRILFVVLLSGFLTGCEKDTPGPESYKPVSESGFHFWGSSSQDQSGVATQLTAGSWTNMGQQVFVRGAMRFDLSGIPSTTNISSAKLTLYSALDPLNGDLINANSGTDNSFSIRRIDNAWTNASANWSNQPTTTITNAVSVPHTDLPFYDVVDIDITALIADLRTAGNYGLMIQLNNENLGNIRQFYSATHPDATKHPRLVITY